MTLGYGPPRSTCPTCLNEGVVSADQLTHNGSTGRGRPLVDAIRFECQHGHGWQVDAEQSMLMGAFLDRQPT